MSTKSFLKKIVQNTKSLFLTGFLTILPLAITFGIFAFSFNFIKNMLRPIQDIEPHWLTTIPHSEILVAIIFILVLGFILKFLLLHSVILLFEAALKKIPLLRQVYFGTKELIQAFAPQDHDSFKKVVLVQFPRKDVYSVGFLTRQMPAELSPQTDKLFYSVFIPATPNPTTGYFIIVEEKDFIITNLTRQEAMTLIISGGIIQPDRFYRNR